MIQLSERHPSASPSGRGAGPLADPTPSSVSTVATASASVVTPLSLVPNAIDIIARDTDYQADSSSSTSCPPNELVVQITTAVIIPDFSRYYETPIQTFKPSYVSLSDGSLVAPPYLDEVHEANWILLIVGALLMLFIRNSVVSADYVRRNRVKFKGLFYTLLISQILGVMTFTSEAWVFLASHVNCKAIFLVQGFATELSALLLLSGILGVKAYRCLGNSKVVLAIIAVLQTASTTLVIIDTIRVQTTRRLSGACAATNMFTFTPAATVIRFGISLFVSFCFIYALIKSFRLPGAQGRISLALSDRPSSERPSSVTTASSESSASIEVSPPIPRPRGWWDYVPEPEVPPDDTTSVSTRGRPGIFRRLWSFRWRRGDSRTWTVLAEKEVPRPPPVQLINVTERINRPLTVRFSESRPQVFNGLGTERIPSPVPSAGKSLKSLMSRMKSFQEALRNELASTAITAIFNVVAATLSLVGAFTCLPASPSFLMAAHWAILSLLVIYSFGRVIERHEREALMQNPSSWDPLYKVEQATGESGVIPRALSTASVASNPRRRRSSEGIVDGQGGSRVTVKKVVPEQKPDNPFADFEPNVAQSSSEAELARRESVALSAGQRSPRILLIKEPQGDFPTSPSIHRGSFRLSSGTRSALGSSFQAPPVLSPTSRMSDSSKYSFFHYDKS